MLLTPNKIKDCSTNAHGLRRIYKNLANRGEATKEIIYKAVESGKYEFSTTGVILTYEIKVANNETKLYLNKTYTQGIS